VGLDVRGSKFRFKGLGFGVEGLGLMIWVYGFHLRCRHLRFNDLTGFLAENFRFRV
jgi:hypothetical protein